MSNIYKMLFLALKKGSSSQNCSSSYFHNPIKNFFYSKICNCPQLGEYPHTHQRYLVKPLIAHLHHKRIFEKKMAKVKITFVYLLSAILLKKSLEQIMKHKAE